MTPPSSPSPAVIHGAALLLLALFLPALLEPKLGVAGLLPSVVLVLAAVRQRARTSTPVSTPSITRWTNAMVALAAMVVTFGMLEYTAKVSVATGLIESYKPMRTLVPAGTEDWRLAHITADRHREADPLLLWRPVARPPYNPQRMKGPVAAVPKPPKTWRIFCYGDSNTDGPDRGGWTEHLATALQELAVGEWRIEVVNAGVVGYSSHQGLLRFRGQVERFSPDVVLVSFGWNDLASALGPPDRAFRPPPPWRVWTTRFLLDFELVRVARSLAARRAPPSSEHGARVPLDDYRANLRGFLATARTHGAVPVLLTRPYRLPTAELRAADGWRSGVPLYNQALIELARRQGVLAIDVQAAFEAATEDFVDECHFTPEGHRRMGRWLAAELAAAKLVPQGPGSL